MWLPYALLSATFAGLVSIFAKLGLKKIDSGLATSIRAVIMAVILAGFVFITGKLSHASIKNIEMKDWVLITLSGIAGAISWLFYFYALKIADGNTSSVAAIDKLSLVFVAIFAVIFLKDHLSLTGILGIILMGVGAVLLSLKV